MSDLRTVGPTSLLAAGPGEFRDSLHAMLVSLPDVLIVQAEDTTAAQGMLHECLPQLVLIDGDLPGNESMQLVSATQAVRPHVPCAILVNDVAQQAAALKAGADHALLKGEPAPRVFAKIERLLGLHRGETAALA